MTQQQHLRSLPIRVVAITGIIVCSSLLTALFMQLVQDDSTSVPTLHSESISCAHPASVPLLGMEYDHTGYIGKWIDPLTHMVLGWSAEEDSAIWNMRQCVSFPAEYPN